MCPTTIRSGGELDTDAGESDMSVGQGVCFPKLVADGDELLSALAFELVRSLYCATFPAKAVLMGWGG